MASVRPSIVVEVKNAAEGGHYVFWNDKLSSSCQQFFLLIVLLTIQETTVYNTSGILKHGKNLVNRKSSLPSLDLHGFFATGHWLALT